MRATWPVDEHYVCHQYYVLWILSFREPVRRQGVAILFINKVAGVMPCVPGGILRNVVGIARLSLRIIVDSMGTHNGAFYGFDNEKRWSERCPWKESSQLVSSERGRRHHRGNEGRFLSTNLDKTPDAVFQNPITLHDCIQIVKQSKKHYETEQRKQTIILHTERLHVTSMKHNRSYFSRNSLRNLQAHYRVHKSSFSVPFLRQSTTAHSTFMSWVRNSRHIRNIFPAEMDRMRHGGIPERWDIAPLIHNLGSKLWSVKVPGVYPIRQ